MIPQDTIQQIRERAADDIVDIIGSYIKLKRAGRSWKAKCPFHDENTASFSVSPERGMYKCFGCGEGGDAIDFIMKHEGLEFLETVRQVADMVGVIIREEKSSAPKNYTPKNKLIPGISEAKRFIRKEEVALLCFNKKDYQALQERNQFNSIFLPHYRPAQVQLIAKYTDHVIIYPKGLNRRKLFKALEITQRENLTIKIAANANREPAYWIHFIDNFFGKSRMIRQQCIKIIAANPEEIQRSIDTHEFSNIWTD